MSERIKNLARWAAVVLGLAAAFWLGMKVSARRAAPEAGRETAEAQHGKHAERAAQVWTCSMHPQIRLPKPGKCPICFMDLIPAGAKGPSGGGPRDFVTTEEAVKLMDIETAPVERRFVETEVRMVGKVSYDETRLGYITARMAGRLDRLFVDYTGIVVRKGDHMAEIYSPDLLVAQQELLQAVRAEKALGEADAAVLRRSVQATLDAAREKLRLWGLTPAQIADIEKRGKGEDHVTLYAPMGGIVIRKDAQQGMYVQTGTPIYTIADLSAVWVKLDAYESDLVWLRYGQKVSIETEAYPGSVFTGQVAFIDPVLNDMKRTIAVRVNAPNADLRLKPGMFVRAVVHSAIAAGGRVMDPGLAGKWISPMHPEIIKDGPGACDVCGMPLVRAEELGYAGVAMTDEDRPLVIPATAPLITGRRAVVYVHVPGAEKPTFAGREIALGPRAGDYYIVAEGLEEGERVVTRGNFKIDSALQIEARPSMMMPDGGVAPAGHAEHATPGGARGGVVSPGSPRSAPAVETPPEFQAQFAAVWRTYLRVGAALAADNPQDAAAAARETADALKVVDMALLAGDAHGRWMKSLAALDTVVRKIAREEKIAGQREQFALLSSEMTFAVKTFGLPPEMPVRRLHCPMAFNNRGADWLQESGEVANPYFGEAMLRCGEVVETLQETGAPGAGGKRHE